MDSGWRDLQPSVVRAYVEKFKQEYGNNIMKGPQVRAGKDKHALRNGDNEVLLSDGKSSIQALKDLREQYNQVDWKNEEAVEKLQLCPALVKVLSSGRVRCDYICFGDNPSPAQIKLYNVKNHEGSQNEYLETTVISKIQLAKSVYDSLPNASWQMVTAWLVEHMGKKARAELNIYDALMTTMTMMVTMM